MNCTKTLPLSFLNDAEWPKQGRGPQFFQIGLSTFGILALELALIRWMSGQVRILAYFNNLILIGCFSGWVSGSSPAVVAQASCT